MNDAKAIARLENVIRVLGPEHPDSIRAAQTIERMKVIAAWEGETK